jgi:hypothetical protein
MFWKSKRPRPVLLPKGLKHATLPLGFSHSWRTSDLTGRYCEAQEVEPQPMELTGGSVSKVYYMYFACEHAFIFRLTGRGSSSKRRGAEDVVDDATEKPY